ncbi:hypothetical protein FHS42_007500, partial [Streptomyces zagrosensis]|nr:hypothetical protein [Streptomyces zagrosensis]
PEVQPIDTSFTWLSSLTWSDFMSHTETFSWHISV